MSDTDRCGGIHGGPADPTDAFAFAFLGMIEHGQVDRYLLRLRAAINARIATDGYVQHIVAGHRTHDGIDQRYAIHPRGGDHG